MTSFNPKYEYPDVLPAYVPPKDRRQPQPIGKKPYLYDGSESTPRSQTESESDQPDDEFLGQCISNEEFLSSKNQIKQSRAEGNSQIMNIAHQRQFEYCDLIDELCDSARSSRPGSINPMQSFDKSLSKKALERSYIQEEVYELKEKLYSSTLKPEPVMLLSTISLRQIDAVKGYEPISLKSYEHVTEYEAQAEEKQPQLAVKKGKKAKKKTGFGGSKYGGGAKTTAVAEEEDEPIKPLVIMRATKAPPVQEISASAESKKSKPKTHKETDVKINEFIKTVVSGGRTSEESENEGWQRSSTIKKPEPEPAKRQMPKKEAKEPEQQQVPKNAPKYQETKPIEQKQMTAATQQPQQQQSKKKFEAKQQQSQDRPPTLLKTQSAQVTTQPIFQQKQAAKTDNIWASLEIVNKSASDHNSTASVDATPPKSKKGSAPKDPQQKPAQPQSTGGSKKKKKKSSASNQSQQQFNALQQELLNVLSMEGTTQDEILHTLASKLTQLYHDPVPQPNPWQQEQFEETKQPEPRVEPASPLKQLTKDEILFHEMVSAQVCQIVKNFEYKLDSVRKEREAAIAIIDRCVKHVFERPHASSRAPIIPVSIKQYGSQASHLAVDSSDVDLAVTGLKLNGDQDLQIYEMRRLHHYFEEVRSEGYIVKLDLIETASVPLIKVQIDLQVIQEITRKKTLQQVQLEGGDISEVPEFVLLDDSMVILHVDIIFDDYNGTTPQLENPQSGNPSNNPFPMLRQNFVPSASLAISSVHKIKELQHQYKDLRHIVLIVKKLLAKHNLHKPYSGGLNSYSIVLMTSTFLEKFGIKHKSALSQNLSEFLKFFGDFFDPTRCGMDGYKFFNLNAAQRASQEHLIVLDIQNNANNTARSSFRIMEAKRVFSEAYRTILENMHKFEQAPTTEERMKINVIRQLIY